MAAVDRIHDAVRNALVKGGWTITDDPFTIEFLEVKLFADLGAERPMSARREERRLVVESKSFIGPSAMHDFKLALGQFLVYRAFLEVVAPEHELVLAIGTIAFDKFFQLKAIQCVLDRYEVPLLIVDVEAEEVVKWTN